MPFLLVEPNITKACGKAKIAPKTVYQWLHESEAFREALRLRRSAIADAAFDGLKGRVERSVETLDGLLEAASETVKRAAAKDILDLNLRIRETQDIEARLSQIESVLEERHEK